MSDHGEAGNTNVHTNVRPHGLQRDTSGGVVRDDLGDVDVV